MDLNKNGSLLRALRQEKGLTQKALAEKLGVVPKTVSKWETGHGFPDVSTLSMLADILGVSEKSLLHGDLPTNNKESGNLKRTKFYVCPNCGSISQTTGACQSICCGKPLPLLSPKSPDEAHALTLSEIEDEFYVEFPHEMTKEHYLLFLACIGFDRVLTIRLYPEQAAAVRIPKMRTGTLLYYCTKHGLFSHTIKPNQKP